MINSNSNQVQTQIKSVYQAMFNNIIIMVDIKYFIENNKIFEQLDLNQAAKITMFDDSIVTPIRTISCLLHKREKATHLCTDLQCVNNPIMCAICFQQPKFRTAHLSHQIALKPINQAVELLSEMIKRQIKPTQSFYERTLGLKQNELIRNNLQKADYLTQEIQNRITSIKMQVDLEIQLLTKEFQRQILLQKQQFLRKIDDYRKTFFLNMQTLKKQSSQIMNFQSSLKFYSNPNTLLLKLSTQAQKRSLDWIIQQKKTLLKVTKFPYNLLSSYINKTNQMNMMMKPVWMGQKKELQNEKELKAWIKTHFDGWIALPELKDLSKSMSHHSSTHGSPSEYRSTGLYTPQSVSQSLYQNQYSNTLI